MKKILSFIAAFAFIYGLSANAVYYTAPNAGNMDFYPMMQRQMEKQETLDFVNHPENYKEMRAAEEEERQYEQDLNNKNFDVNSSKRGRNRYFKYTTPVKYEPAPKMEFSKDADGNVIIKETK